MTKPNKDWLTISVEILLMLAVAVTSIACFAMDNFIGGVGWLGYLVTYFLAVFWSE